MVALTEFIREYNKIYQEGTELFNKFNICDISNGTCYRGRRQENPAYFCCDGCEYLSDTGCTAKSLWCKLWLCYIGERKAKGMLEFERERKLLKTKADKLCRGTHGRYNMSDYIRRFYYRSPIQERRKQLC